MMQRLETIAALRAAVADLRAGGRTVGLVPTMGALHEGHMSLVGKARSHADVVVVSAFVNPTQFNDAHDYETYPRTPEADAQMLETAGVDILFTPAETEVYPEPDTRVFDLGSVADVMEGPRRPGHFNGVCQIVSKLFDYVQPDYAFFGEKDFQQIAVIRRMLEITGQKVEIVPCPIVREDDGLAKSSRNVRLSAQQRSIAPQIHSIMDRSKALKADMLPTDVRDLVVSQINTQPDLKVEYYDIVDGRTLLPIARWSDTDDPVGCITVYCGEVRLIDNIHY
ncbi:Pantothenate synthetase [Porphyromonas crevioricanis]|uniref:Pantothenate synthetase n=2 Tax=Porphyromonas crevioricanis TaxID=393921 RepID=A0A2X4PI11_9PORP|nr:pantoate-beta-alanine ligase [Porphyromonas crevioricanis JCM 13913]SQH72290.1 Pantothenate synthetase [Porphyromonas crevioricanis]